MVRLGRKFVTNTCTNTPPHPKCVATLPCAISVFKKSRCFVSKWSKLFARLSYSNSFCSDLCCLVAKSSPRFRCTSALNPAISIAPIESPRYGGPSLWRTTFGKRSLGQCVREANLDKPISGSMLVLRVIETTESRVRYFSNVSRVVGLCAKKRFGQWLMSVAIAYRRRGVAVSGVRRMNEVNPRWSRLVLGWVTVFGRIYHLCM